MSGKWALIVLIVMILSGCAAVKTVSVDRTIHIEDLVHRVQARNAAITTLKGNGTLTMESPEASSSGSFAVELRKPDSLRVDLRGPFGIRIGTLAASRDTFLFYNWRENHLTAGKPDQRTLRSVLRLNIGYEQILDGFTGAFFSKSSDLAQWDLTAGAENYVLRHRRTNRLEEYTVEPSGQIVTGFRLLDSLGTPELIALASDLDDEPVVMPRLIRIVLPKERQSISIAYDDVWLNTTVNCAFTPPRTPGSSAR